MNQPEWILQRSMAVYLAKALPHTAYWTSIDMGRSASARAGQLRKLRGCRAGIPDILIVHETKTLWLEAKAGSSLSEPQKLFRDQVTANGHLWFLVRSPEDVEAACLSAGIPLRATVSAISDRIAEQRSRLPAKRKAVPRTPGGPARMSVAQYRKLHSRGLV